MTSPGWPSFNAPTPQTRVGWFADPWCPGQLPYFDGVQWTDGVAALRPVPGLPLGQRTLYLRKTPRQIYGHGGCSILNGDGMTIATVRSHTRIPWVFGRNRRTLRFEVIGTDGASRFRIARYGGLRPHRIQVDDIEGRKLGQLRQMSSSWKQFRTGRITFAVESHQNHLATADIRIVPSDNRYADVREPIYDTAGVVIATVQRQGRYTGVLTDSFGYRLDCPEQCADPLPALLFACLFAYYLYDLLALGGLLGIGRTRPSWEMMGYEAKMPPA